MAELQVSADFTTFIVFAINLLIVSHWQGVEVTLNYQMLTGYGPIFVESTPRRLHNLISLDSNTLLCLKLCI